MCFLLGDVKVRGSYGVVLVGVEVAEVQYIRVGIWILLTLNLALAEKKKKIEDSHIVAAMRNFANLRKFSRYLQQNLQYH